MKRLGVLIYLAESDPEEDSCECGNELVPYMTDNSLSS